MHRRKSARAGAVDAHRAGTARIDPRTRGRKRRKVGNREFTFGMDAGYSKTGAIPTAPHAGGW
ncbi:hypothetical protein GCM10022626_17810 [[Pseudomonas] carboxydohydrogena]